MPICPRHGVGYDEGEACSACGTGAPTGRAGGGFTWENLLLAAICLGAVAAAVYLGLGSRTRPRDPSAMGEGSPAYAASWRDRLAPLGDPDEAKGRYPDEVRAARFPSGEWVFGVCEDSHGNPDGGTVVVKDSTGKVRAFFGHVCGRFFLVQLFETPRSLAEFYGNQGWEQFRFREYPLP